MAKPCCSPVDGQVRFRWACTQTEKHGSGGTILRLRMFAAAGEESRKLPPVACAMSTSPAPAGPFARMALHTAPFRQGESAGPRSRLFFRHGLCLLGLEGPGSRSIDQKREKPKRAYWCGSRWQALAEDQEPQASGDRACRIQFSNISQGGKRMTGTWGLC